MTSPAAAAPGEIRTTNERPPRLSVHDVIQRVLGIPRGLCSPLFDQLAREFREIRALCANFRFPGRGAGRRATPVTCFKIMMRLSPPTSETPPARQVADVLVRALGAARVSEVGEDEERALKRRRVDLQLRREEFELDRAQRDYALDRQVRKREHAFQLDKAQRDYELDWQARKLTLEVRKRAALS